MAQYNKQNNSFLPNGTSLFEVVMLADQEGNISSGGGNFSGSAVDAFGRARMSQPVTLFDSSNVGWQNDKFGISIVTLSTANTAYNSDDSSVELNVGAVNDQVLSRSKRRFAYQPGKSLLVLNTFDMAPAAAGLIQRVGYYDNDDGVFLEVTNDGVYFVKRSSSSGSIVETRVEQANWNGDVLDGSENSTSGITLDMDKSQILWQDFEWLGVGSVRCGFVIDGKLITAHTFHHSNIAESTYMASANLPISYEIRTDVGFTGTAQMKQICSSVISEGGYEPRAKEKMVGTTDLATAVSTTAANVWISIASIELSDARAIVVPAGAELLNISNADFEWGLFVDATFASPLTYTPNTSRVNASIQGIAITDVGTRIAGGYMAGKATPASLGDGSFNWTSQLEYGTTLTLAIRSDSQSKKAAGLLKWYEL